MAFEDVLKDFPVLKTNRLNLRRFRPADRDAILKLYGDPDVTRYNESETFTSLDDADNLMKVWSARWKKRSGVQWAMTFKKGGFIGTCGFIAWDEHNRYASIAYDLMQPYWGQGLMSEAIKTVLKFGFGTLNLNRIEATVTVGNNASGRVLRKLGFTMEGTLRERGFWKNRFHDLELYSLLKRESN